MRTNLKTLPSTRAFTALVHFSGRGSAQRHLAYFAAGWLTLIGLSPLPSPSSRAPASGRSVLAGGALAVGALVFIVAPLLDAMSPVIQTAGRVDAEGWLYLMGGILLVWRYFAGRKALQRFEKALIGN